jgi:tetratricopeptide (TPR) repeat protein
MLKWFIALGCLSLIGCASTATKNKEKAELYLRMGATQIETADYPQALRNILAAEELDPTSPVIQNNLGLVYFFRERYDLAEKHLIKATVMDPKYSEARNNLSRVYLEEGKYDLAEKEVQIVLNDLTFTNPEKAYINLGLVKFNRKQYTAARAAFGKALKLVPDDCIASTYIGRTFFESEDYPQAAESLDKAIGFCQKSLFDEPHYYSALAYYRLGDKSKAAARFEELIKYYPSGTYREKAKGMLSLIRKGH